MDIFFNAIILKKDKPLPINTIISSLLPNYSIEDEDIIEMEDSMFPDRDVYLDFYSLDNNPDTSCLIMVPNLEIIDFYSLDLEAFEFMYVVTYATVISHFSARRFRKNINDVQLIYDEGKLKHKNGLYAFDGLTGEDLEKDMAKIFKSQLGKSFHDFSMHMPGKRFYFE